MRVAALWRYPVKSLAGEARDALDLDARGVEYDRAWAFVDPEGGIASGKATRRFRKVPDLLRHRSRFDGDGPVVELADGRVARPGTTSGDALLASIVPPGWTLQPERATPHHDAGPVHLVTTATLATIAASFGEPISPDRLRPNLLIDTGSAEGWPEDGWVGRTLAIGAIELRVTGRTERCVMVGQAQRALPRRPRLLQAIGRLNDVCAGVYADVVTPGRIRAGDAVTVRAP
jgi:uncharacterized protein YcbX